MLQATKHQGQSFFRGNGRQCVANSVQALLTAQQLSPSEWTTSTLDKILEDGDTLYCQIVPERNKYLKFEDLPSRIGDTTISLHESLCGTLTRDITNKPFYSIRDAINQLMSNDTTCLFTMGSYSLSYTCGIVKNAAKFYFFDPHSRADTGMVAADGVATMTIHKNVFDLSQFIKHLAASLGNADDTQFEMASVVVSKTQFEKVTFSDVLDSSSEGGDSFSGYSSESDGEIACRLYLKMEKENLQVENVATPDVLDANTSDLSNYSSSSFDDTSTCSSIESINTDTLEANLHDSFLQSFNDDVVDDIINESYSEQLSKNTDQEMHENVYEYTAIRLDDYADDYVNNDDERDKDYNPDDDDDDDDDDDTVYCNRNDDDSSDTLNFYQQKTQSSRAANIKNTQNSHKMNDDDTYTLLVTKGDGNQDSQVTGNGTQSSQETNGNDRQCPQVHSLTTNDDATPKSLVNSEVANNDSQSSQVNSQVLNDIQNSLINSQVGNESGSQVNEDGKTITLKRGRKRHRDVHNWKRNRTKKRCNEGKSYTTRKGNKKPARAMKPGCGHGCRNKCQGKFNESERHTIFHSYWQLGDIYKQRQFIAKFATIKVTGKNKLLSSSSRRKWTVSYSLPQRQADGSTKAVKVCKTFFHHTLGITDRTVSTVHKKLSAIGICMEDLRGRHNNRPNRTTENQQSDIRKHIESFQPIESHYCRKDSGKQYLPANLTVSKMYEAYTENCPLSEVPASINVYRRIFNEEYNLSFHSPLKDQCDQCAAYRNASPEEKDKLQSSYEKHILNKELAKRNKETDKQTAKNDQSGKFTAACFDLEEVLQTPHSFESAIYYKRRLSTYNFTMYDLGTTDAYSYVWNETISSRGANDIASCVYSFIQDMHKRGKQNFVFFSDNCFAQDKNRFYATMLWYCLQKFDLSCIEHKYLEKGHTFNENDSVHSAIEKASRNIPVYTTRQWAATVRAARLKRPYKVKEMTLINFFDFKKISEKIKNFDVNTKNDKVYWSKIKLLKLSSSNPNTVQYKTDYEGEWYEIDLLERLRQKEVPNPKSLSLTQLNTTEQEISWDKYKDLLTLCRMGIIPRAHHEFLMLPHELR